MISKEPKSRIMTFDFISSAFLTSKKTAVSSWQLVIIQKFHSLIYERSAFTNKEFEKSDKTGLTWHQKYFYFVSRFFYRSALYTTQPLNFAASVPPQRLKFLSHIPRICCAIDHTELHKPSCKQHSRNLFR